MAQTFIRAMMRLQGFSAIAQATTPAIPGEHLFPELSPCMAREIGIIVHGRCCSRKASMARRRVSENDSPSFCARAVNA